MASWRWKLLFGLCVALAAAVGCRLFYVQVLNYQYYRAQVLGQQTSYQGTQGDRGQVFLTDSQESRGAAADGQTKSLAINNRQWIVYAVPKQIADKNQFAQTLSGSIGMPANDITSRLAISDTYAIVKKNVSDDQLASIKALQLNGLYWQETPQRYYPQQQLAAQVMGFVGGNGSGQYGLEGYYNNLLEGKQGVQAQAAGLAAISPSNAEGSLDGSDLYLTIDYNIQFEAEQLLAEAHDSLKMDSGQIIVLKPDTGRVLAMAGYPSFDPNQYSKVSDFSLFQNASVQQIFEPGSVFKPFTMAMALEEKKVTPQTTFNDTGSVKFGPDTVYNFDHKSYGVSDMSKILEKSINTGAVFLEQQIPHPTFWSYLQKFGLLDKTGIDLQGEVAPQNPVLQHGGDFQYATAAFGQGIDMTPIRLAASFCMFANGGHLVKPYVVDKIVHNGQQQEIKPQTSAPVISSTTDSEVTQMLINVVERGFGDIAKIPGYWIAGKTGTAQVPRPSQGGYYPNRTIQNFIGYGPAWNPQFLILVKFDNPKVSEAALSAAPYFKQMAQYLIDYWQIPPDYQVPASSPK